MSEQDEIGSNFVMVLGLCRVTPAEYEAQWNGVPLRIALDMGATLKLLGEAHDGQAADVLSAKAEIVARTAQRLIDMRLEKPSIDEALVTISALDLVSDAEAPEIAAPTS